MANNKSIDTDFNEDDNISTGSRIVYYPEMGTYQFLDDITYTIFSVFDRVKGAKIRGDRGTGASVTLSGTSDTAVLNQSTGGEFGSAVRSQGLPQDTSDLDQETVRQIKEAGLSGSGTFIIDKEVQRLDRSIVLPMPNQVLSPLRTSVSQISQGLLTAAIATGLDVAQQSDSSNSSSALAKAAILAAKKKGLQVVADSQSEGVGGDIVRGLGLADNERKESFFGGVEIRRFDFLFQFSPRSLDQAQKIQEIIEYFRFYMLPTFNNDRFYLIQPAEFEIKFMVGTEENTNIPKIDRCLLEACNVNYSPRDKWVVVAGSKGFPAEITMNLSFVEKQTMYREKVGGSGFGKGY